MKIFKGVSTSLHLPTTVTDRADMLMVYNIFHRNVNIQPGQFFHQLPSVTRGHSYKIFKPHAHDNCPQKLFFAIRSINEWNQLATK